MILAISSRYHLALARAAAWLRNKLRQWHSGLARFEYDHGSAAMRESPLARLRFAACTKCPNLTKFDTCSLCKCYMPAKVQIAQAKCPDGKW